MKRKLLSIISVAILATMFTSCNESDDITPIALGDVYVKVKTISEKTQYALYAYAYANVELKSAILTNPTDEAITLTARENQANVFSNSTDTDELYSEAIPTKGEYSFAIETLDGVDLNITDVLSDDMANIPVVSSATQANSEISVVWTETVNADYFILKLIDINNKVIFSTDYLPAITLTKTILDSTEGWAKDKNINHAVKVMIMAIKFEDSAVKGNYDIQSIAEGFKDIER